MRVWLWHLKSVSTGSLEVRWEETVEWREKRVMAADGCDNGFEWMDVGEVWRRAIRSISRWTLSGE